ncbi:MAG: hypothetical protein QOE77_1557 [Blastocatellia bacterium]|jgi:cyclic beta-1,2-glucan synthetase|nr:hypothetical protein [Blastocatellia bacterium]
MGDLFSSLFGRLQRPSDAERDDPIYEELYSTERLEQFAGTLAQEHKIAANPRRRGLLLQRLEDNGRKLLAAYHALAEAIRRERTISPAAEWLVDNFHIVEEQVREIREDLPRGYYHELPKLAEGPLKDYPRIYAFAIALIAHTDSRLDTETLRRFITAYQKVSPLSIGELWAVPITLRLALVENLRRLATRIVSSRVEREEADKLADRLLEIARRQPADLVQLLADRMAKRGAIRRAFVVQLTQRLREQDPAVMPVFDWLEERLSRENLSTEQVVQTEHQRQAAAQITVGNIITSMRLLSTLDWQEFFEKVSLIDPLLSEDPAGIYARMDFATRDRYRHVIERISKRTKTSELEIARGALKLAREAEPKDGADDSRNHVGYFLIDEGVPQLETAFAYRARLTEGMRRFVLKHPTPVYLGLVVFLTSLVLSLLVVGAARAGGTWPWLIAVALLALIPASDLALSVLNWDLTHTFAPRVLPMIDTLHGVPTDSSTMVVVPAIFDHETAALELIDKLEVHFLANRDQNIYFALLGDFADSDSDEMPGDTALLDATLSAVETLNHKYQMGDGPRFHLFHRRRLWNASEGKWMGWERKRGKLHEFNQLLRGARDTSFMVATAAPEFLAGVRYVITLDADTQLPRDAARRLVGKAMHPLNRPHFDAASGRVTRGYGILQPRVSMSLLSASRSRFARIFSGNTGIDPYTTAASDVYQDLFGEGIYTGKGLYDVDAFDAALANRVRENSLLSHDLFESLFARAALVTDIELLDDYPAHYDAYAMRQHRWTRGDWQIAGHLLPRVRDARGEKRPNQIPLIGRWKIFDNLRRSLLAPAMLLLLIAGWTVLPGRPVWWTLFAVLVLAFPIYAHVTAGLLLHPRGIAWTSHFWSVWGDVRTHTAQVALSVSFLAHQASLMSDAIGRTVYRKLFSGRKLLEWTTAAQAEGQRRHDVADFVRLMWPAGLATLEAAALIITYRPQSLAVAAPFLLAWIMSPLVAYWTSLHLETRRRELDPAFLNEARLVARRTWRFFETFVGDEDHWLPPDNFQEDPQPLIAHRTSPTNLGLLLLSTVAAHDFGYVAAVELAERLELSCATITQLRTFRGHYFNWYDTRTLEPLAPQYISTVDSGNFAGHLIALKQACVEQPDRQLFDERVINGLRDTISCLQEEAGRLGAVRQRTEVVTTRQLRSETEACAALLAQAPPDTLSGWAQLFTSMAQRAHVIDDIVGALSHEHGNEAFHELRFWIGALTHQIRSYQRDFDLLVPWGAALSSHLDPIIRGCSADIATAWDGITQALQSVPSLAQIALLCDDALVKLAALRAQLDDCLPRESTGRDAALNGLQVLTGVIEQAAEAARTFSARLGKLANTCDRIFDAMDFRFLLDEERKVFVIGYNVKEGRTDNSYYDLLASESRLASFVAIARGDVPQEHWFRLGRQLTSVDHSRALISWTGTMFEYLMPLLVMRDYDDTLLGQTYESVVARQVAYGRERSVPWGISESAYNVRDLQLNYQYGPFGVPGLGLKRGLSEDLVVSPYATMLAATVRPNDAIENLRALAREGALASYGFYEAIDYTPERLPQDQKRVLIRTFMAHHQGMSLVALDNVINGGIMQQRFHAEPLVQATELLLQERIPRGVTAAHPRAEEVLTGRVVRTLTGLPTRVYDTPHLPTPRTQLLSNGTYTVMITSAGSGYSQCGPLAVTRWREDVTRDHWGSYCYVRDVRSGAVWCTGFQPVGREPQSYAVAFSEDKVDFWRQDGGISTHTEVVVSAEDNAELRRVSVTNNSSRPREIELTSYSEIVLAPPAADAAHPAFSNLFVETEFFAAESALLARRRQRSAQDDPVWGVHVIATTGETIGVVQYETDRARFIGRGHTPADPIAVMEDRPLSNTTGAVLDPVFSLRCRMRLKPNETAQVSFATAVAHSREEATSLADKYHDPNIFEREARLAWTRAQVEMSHLKIDAEEAHLFQRIGGRVLYSDPSLRPRPHVLALNKQAQSNLWPYGISGDLPIVLVRINKEDDVGMVRQIARAHEYLHLKGLRFDLVILNDHPATYAQSLQDGLQGLVRTTGMQALQDKAGGVYLRRADLMPEADKILLHAVARAVFVTERGSLEEQLGRRPVEDSLPPAFVPRTASQHYPEPVLTPPPLSFFNGLGGFSEGGREYVIALGEGQWTPAPWANIIANEIDFGFQVTETGAGFAWSQNSHENRLTAWSNDAVSDPPGEVIYIRDEETGTFWTATPLPVRESQPYLIRHGKGYTVFEHTSHGISQELLLFVPRNAPVKISLLRLQNRTNRTRRLAVTSYNELVLGSLRSSSAPYVITEIDNDAAAIFARNPYNNEFAGRVAFAGTSGDAKRSMTCDRKEFLGRNGSADHPAALRRAQLSGRDGAGLDPCSAIQTLIELAPGEAREVVFLLGQTASIEEAREVNERYRQLGAVHEAFEEVAASWESLSDAIEVRTPDPALDTLLNGWLVYQTLSCRVWARSAFYQSGGAYGFRDQLQDVMALVYAAPQVARAHIVRAAARQFKEGDVQHWWHPPTGRGVRTRFSDDLLWLPYVAAFYINVTGDIGILDEVVPFIEAPLLTDAEQESYTQPVVSTETATVFEHCARAIDRSLAVGEHGLPLMGSGDWNDGMNRVGHGGKGESVWVGWFLFTILGGFAPFCDRGKETARADRYRGHAEKLKDALEQQAWDGDWYRRAYFDDGTPLGSVMNEECRIDSIAQSWGVISGAADHHRAVRSMAAVEEYLIRRGDGLVILFTPPFDKSPLDPGYIKGYVPGVRENGGQYTHAALWTLIAYAMLGEGDRAGELFALLNPINHASTRAGLHKYKVEPYVAAGDVYAVPPHTGRGGWTWYTGSAGWMYRAGLESMLGFKLRGNVLRIDPCIPRNWRDFEITYRRGKTPYRIKVENPIGISSGVARVELDGVLQTGEEVKLQDDGQPHHIHVVLGEKPPNENEGDQANAHDEERASRS